MEAFMETVAFIISAKHFFAAIIAYGVVVIVGGWFAKKCWRGIKLDIAIANQAYDIHFEETMGLEGAHANTLESFKAWNIAWSRQDLAMCYGQLSIISGLLGAILVVLMLK